MGFPTSFVHVESESDSNLSAKNPFVLERITLMRLTYAASGGMVVTHTNVDFSRQNGR